MLAHLLAPLNVVLFRLGNDQVTAAELLGFVTGAASVWLTVLARTRGCRWTPPRWCTCFSWDCAPPW